MPKTIPNDRLLTSPASQFLGRIFFEKMDSLLLLDLVASGGQGDPFISSQQKPHLTEETDGAAN